MVMFPLRGTETFVRIISVPFVGFLDLLDSIHVSMYLFQESFFFENRSHHNLPGPTLIL